MKTTLNLRLGQSLTMTPQLQQAIKLLQLSNIELQTEIQEALESNIMLEKDEEPAIPDGQDTSNNAQEQTERQPGMETNKIPEELAVDTVWEEIYDNTSYYSGTNSSSMTTHEGAAIYAQQGIQNTSLQEHLRYQFNLIPTADQDKAIAVTIIDSIDDDGYLSCGLEEIIHALNQHNDGESIDLAQIEAVLHLIQSLEPSGIAARDLNECLQIQLNQLAPDTAWLEEAKTLVDQYMPLLATRDYARILQGMKLNKADLQKVIALIQSMNPRPGGQMNNHPIEYIVPDAYVKKINDTWQIKLNTEAIPNIRINYHYANMVKCADNRYDSRSLKTHLQEANWLIKSIQSRSETLLKVASCIIERQRAFLEYGEEAMRPMILSDIAEELGMHESTISRATTKKYIHTPRGIFELKHFFSSHVSTHLGGACSATAIRAVIKKLIQAENACKPLSDNKIMALLSEQGINIARRTVTKYRESIHIPPSNERKKII